jgi:hypothetical protein
MPFTVFISSTSRDLPDHRIAVERSLLDAGLCPIGMEHFAAQPEKPVAACLREVGEADLFVGVYGWRYGFVPSDTAVSITEMEFSEAQRLGKPCFCFFVDPGFTWPEELRDHGEPAARLAEFKRRVDGILVRSTFTTPHDLAVRVLASIQRYERSQTRRAALPPAQSPEQRNLTTLLERGKQFWIAGVLANVAGSVGTYSLAMTPVPDAVEQPWRDGTSVDLPAPQAIALGLSVLDVFERSGRLLLILGDPGSGKTVTLLQLAQHLIEQARSVSSEPVPVVFHLGSWSAQRLALEKWLILEAQSKYYISADLFEKWLREQRIVLLLDGLDEVERSQQDACVRGINTFIGTWGVPGISICARREEYLSLPTRLRLNAAVSLDALSTDQIAAILSSSEQPAQNLRRLLETAPAMAELAGSPLMLNLMRATTYSNQDSPAASRDLTSLSSADAVVSRYVDARLSAEKFDSSQRRDVVNRLSWIAKRVIERGGIVFQIDALQPSQLDGVMRAAYWLLSRAAIGIMLGATEGTYLGLIQWLQLPFATNFIRGVSTGLLFGMGAGLMDMVWHDLFNRRLNQRHRDQPSWLYVFVNVLLLFALFALAHWSLWQSWERAGFGIVWALLVGLRRRGSALTFDIRMPDIRAWSWRAAAKGFAIGAMIGASIFVVPVFFGAYSSVVRELSKLPVAAAVAVACAVTALYGMIGAVFMGWRASAIASRVHPNEGIRLFTRSMLRGGLVLGAVTGGFIWIAVAAGFLQAAGFAKAVIAGLILGLIVGGYFAVIGALWYGGIDVINHYLLRSILWITGRTPLRLIRCLDEAVEMRLLRRIGGGYAFIHRALLEYFAAREPTSKP